MIPRYSKCPTKHNGPPIGLTSEAGTDEYEVHQEIERICQHTMEEIECDWCDQAHAASSSTDLNHPWTSSWSMDIHGIKNVSSYKNTTKWKTHKISLLMWLMCHVSWFLIIGWRNFHHTSDDWFLTSNNVTACCSYFLALTPFLRALLMFVGLFFRKKMVHTGRSDIVTKPWAIPAVGEWQSNMVKLHKNNTERKRRFHGIDGLRWFENV